MLGRRFTAYAAGLPLALVAPALFLACGQSSRVASEAQGGTSATSGATGTTGTTGAGGSAGRATGGGAGHATSGGAGHGTGGQGEGGAGGARKDGGKATDAAGDHEKPDGAGDAASDVLMLSDAILGDAIEEPLACNTVVTQVPPVPSPHMPLCLPIVYGSNPPTSGPHYPIWAAYQIYTSEVAREFYVHDLEHGAIVITYNCPGDCTADLAALYAMVVARPADPLCSPPVSYRFVVTPDPLLDVPFAASAWGWDLKSQCFDLVALAAFMDAHYAHAPEDFCSDGIDPTSPDSGIPPGCGLPGDGGAD